MMTDPQIAFAIPIPIRGVMDSGVEMKYHVRDGIPRMVISASIMKSRRQAVNAAPALTE
jgi:hypothetical protein